VVERKFQTLYAMRSVLNGARLSKDLRNGLCAERMTKLENLLVDQGVDKCPYEKFDGALPKFCKFLRTFGGVGIVLQSAR